MSYEKFLEPKEVTIEDKTFVISKFPAIAGRKIVTKYISNGMPKIGNYEINEEQMLELMKYVAAIDSNGNKVVLVTEGLINNHVVSKSSSWEMLVKIEMAMMEYNCAFFRNGSISTFLEDIKQKLPPWITKMLKASSVPSSPQVTQPTEN